jgi:hypothetical protein
MSTPSDPGLYEAIKKRVYSKMKTHSAYRSGHVVQEYKKAFALKHGSKEPYKGATQGGLKRWFAENWRNESGGIGYDASNTLYRPTVRVSTATPKTWKELTPGAVREAKKEKTKKGRVYRF